MHPFPTTAEAGVAPDTDAVTTHVPVPGLGILPVNAFVIHADEPVLVDTGVVAQGAACFEALTTRIDPADLRWIWLTHTDADHTGCLGSVLEAAPRARVVTTFLGLGKLGLREAVPPERVRLLNPGQSLHVGDRRLRCLRPPTYDAPETTGLLDEKTGAWFGADSFGAVLSAPAEDARAIDPDALRDGLIAWSHIDAPWLTGVRHDVFERELAAVRDLSPTTILGAHLPPAPGMADTLTGYLRAAVDAPPMPAPDQAAFEQMLAAS